MILTEQVLRDVLEAAERALTDLGACDDPNCCELNCVHALVKVRAALARGAPEPMLRAALSKAVAWAAGYPLGGDMDRIAALEVYHIGTEALAGIGVAPAVSRGASEREPSVAAIDAAYAVSERRIGELRTAPLVRALRAAYAVDFPLTAGEET